MDLQLEAHRAKEETLLGETEAAHQISTKSLFGRSRLFVEQFA